MDGHRPFFFLGKKMGVCYQQRDALHFLEREKEVSMRKKASTTKPSKSASILSGVIACAMGVFGLFTIPSIGGAMIGFKGHLVP